MALATCDAGLGAKVDVTAPILTVITPEKAGGYFKGALSLRGTATDDRGLVSLKVSWQGASGTREREAISSLNGTSWSLELTSGTDGDLPEGTNNVTVEVADGSGKTASQTMLVYIDNKPATVLVTYPLSHGNMGSTNDQFRPGVTSGLDVKGEVYDESPITSVVVSVLKADGSSLIPTEPKNALFTKTADGTNTFSVRFPLKTNPEASAYLNDQQTYLYQVTATDLAGNQNSVYYHSQDVFTLLPPNTPFPTVSEIGKLNTVGLPGSVSSPSRVQYNDLSSKRLGRLGSASQWGDFKYVQKAVPTIAFSNLDKTAPQNQNLLGVGSVVTGNIIPPVNSGAIDLTSVRIEVYRGVVVPTSSDTPVLSLNASKFGKWPSPGPSVAGTTDKNELVALGDSYGFTIDLRSVDPADFSPGAVLPPDPYFVVVSAKAQGSDVNSDLAAFFVDSSAPNLYETNVGLGSVFKTAGFSLGGQASTAPPTALATVTVKENDSALPAKTFTFPSASQSAGWTIPGLPVGGADGTYNYEIVLTTSSGKTSPPVYRNVTLDTTPPSLSVNTLSPLFGSSVVSSTLSASFIASDSNGVQSLRWWVVPNPSRLSATPSAPQPNWADTGLATYVGSLTAAPYLGTLSTTSLAQGHYTLWLAAHDRAGNEQWSSSPLVVDQLPPALAVSNPDTTLVGSSPIMNSAQLAAFNSTGFTGTISDTSEASSLPSPALKVTYTKDGGTPVGPTPLSPNSAGAWSWKPSLVDGVYSFVFTATDFAGRTTSVTRSFSVDTSGPVVTVNVPTTGSWTNLSSYQAIGFANDGSGSGTSAVYLRIDDATVDHSSDVTNSGWTLANGTVSWNASVGLGAEGAKKLWVKAEDAAGNVTLQLTTVAGNTVPAVNFGRDVTSPILGTEFDETAIGAATVNRKDPFVFGGAGKSKASDALSGVRSLTVTDNGANQASIAVTSGEWIYDISPLPSDGYHAYVFTLTDNANNQSTMTRAVVVDTTPAVAAVTVPAEGLKTNQTTVNLLGSSNDGAGSGVAEVWYRLDAAGVDHSGDSYNYSSGNLSGWTRATGTTSWSATESGLTDGMKKLWVKTLDNAGNVTTGPASALASPTFTVDTTAPVLEETAVVSTSYRNGLWTFSGTATDALSGIGSLKVTDNGSVAQTVTVSTGQWSFTPAVLPSDGVHTYVFTLFDLAGNQTTKTRTVIVDKTPADASVASPAAGLKTTATSLILSGSANDGAGSGVAEVWYRLDASGIDHSSDAYNFSSGAIAGWTKATGTATWTGELTGLPEGNKRLWVKTLDNAGNVTTSAACLAQAVSLIIDLTPPSLGESTVGTGSVYRPAAFNFGGFGSASNASDSLSGLGALTVTDNGASMATIAVDASGDWSYSVSGLADGTHTFLFTLVDQAGNQTTLGRQVVVDTIPASYSINVPLPGALQKINTLTIAGSANDGSGSGVTELWYKVDASTNDHSSDAYSSWTKATGTTTWSASLTGLTEGTKKLWVKSIDGAGNQTTASTALSMAVNFTVDLTPPSLSEAAIGAAVVSKRAAYSFGGAGSLSSATDALSGIDTLTVSDNGGALATIAVDGAGKWSYSPSVPADGNHTYLFTLKDLAGNQTTLTRTVIVDTLAAEVAINSPLANAQINATTVNLAGSSNDGSGSGVAEVWYTVDAAANDHSADLYSSWTMAQGTNTWSASLSGLNDGDRKLWVKVVDVAGNVSAARTVAFTVDTTPPVLGETAVGATTVYKNGLWTFGGAGALSVATDNLSGVSTLTVTDNGANTQTVAVNGGSWSYRPPVLPSEGSHTFLFTLSDQAGNQTNLTRTVVVDTVAPVPMVGYPSSGWISSATPTLMGSASDGSGSGVKEVWYLIDVATNDHSSDSYTTWTKVTGTTSWTKTTAILPEGQLKLWLKTVDNVGNFTSAAGALATLQTFGVDTVAPSLGIDTLTAYNSSPTISGTVADSGSGVTSLQYKLDTGSYTTVSVAASWSFAIPTASFAALTEGPHTVTVAAYDGAGNLTTHLSSFNKDSTAPTLSHTTISASGGTVVQDSLPILRGTLQDASGLANTATFTVENYSYAKNLWTNIPEFIAASLSVTGNPTTFNWSVDLSSYPDGRYRISFTAPDIVPGAPNTLNTSAVTFFVSRSSPAAEVTTPSMGSFQSGAFPMTGTVADFNAVTGVVAKIGSGSVDFSSGTTPAYAAADISGLDLTTDVFTTFQHHGLNAGDTVYFSGALLPAVSGATLSAATACYVISANLSATTFSVSLTSGGSKADFNGNGSQMLVGGPTMKFIPVQAVAASGTMLTSPGHGLTAGNVVYFQGASVSPATAYYVLASGLTASTFTVGNSAGGSAVTIAGSGLTFTCSNKSVKWLLPALSVGGFSEGPLTAFVRVSNSSTGKVSQTSRDFVLDSTAPSISIVSPGQGTRSVGSLTLIGTTTDPGSVPAGVISTIQYQVGKNFNLSSEGGWLTSNVTGGSYSWNITLGNMSGYANATWATESDSNGTPASGTNLWKLPIVFQSVDKGGNVGQLTSYYLILDPNGNVPIVTVTQPASALTFGGQVRVTGTAVQPTWIHDVEVAIDPTGGNNFPASPVAVTVAGSTLTSAGHPFTNGMRLYVSGTSAPQIGGVPVSPSTGYWVVNRTANTLQISETSGGTPVTFSGAGSGVTATVWGAATLITTGNNVIWYSDLNFSGAYPQSGAINQTLSIQARAWNSPTAGGVRGTMSGTLTNPLTMTFNSTFPKIQDLMVNGATYYSQMTTRGTFSLTASVSSSKGISRIDVVESSPLSGATSVYDTDTSFGTTSAAKGSFWSSVVVPPATKTSDSFVNGNSVKVMIVATGSTPSLWTAAGAPTTTPGTVFTPNNLSLSVAASGGSFLESDASGNFNYTATLSIDSSQMYSSTTGQYAIDLRASDLGSPAKVSTTSVVVNEDNYFPTSSILSSSTLVGSSFKVQGTATDTGSGSGIIAGLKKIVVYMVRSGAVLNIKSGSGQVAPGTITAKDMSNAGAVGSVPYPDTTLYSNYFASIDNRTENGSSDVNGDGFQESLLTNGNSLDWWVQLNTAQLADGPVEVHYVVWDNAGNATHYVQAGFVSNNPPTITGVQLGTDLNGDQSIATAEVSPSTSNVNTSFTVRNNRLSVKPTVAYNGSNSALSYKLEYYNGTSWVVYADSFGSTPSFGGTTNGVTLSNLDPVSRLGESVTLNWAANGFATIPDAALNTAVFRVTVTDGTLQSAAITFNLGIQNNDNVAPTVDLAPMGQRYSAPLDANNGYVNFDTTKTLAASTYSENVKVSDGTDGYTSGTKEGHVEYATQSPFNPLSVTMSVPSTGSFTNSGANSLASGMVVYLAWATAPSSAPNGAGPYYVLPTPSATAFQLSATKGGAPASFGSAGSGLTVASPDISGKVIFRGKFADNQRLSNFQVTISGFNGGNAFTVATWSATANSGAGGLVPSTGTGWTFALDPTTESLSAANGHVANWAFTWDSSQVTGVAAKNVSLVFKVTDFGGGTASSGTTVDVVPYISKLVTGLSLAYRNDPSVFNRTLRGNYPVAEGGTVEIQGFNLNGTANTGVYVGATQVTSTYLALGSALPTPANTDLVATLNSALGLTSGSLKVTVNSVDSLNNSNSNLSTWNQEPNNTNNKAIPSNPAVTATNLTDDRAIDVWKFASPTGHTASTFGRICYPQFKTIKTGGTTTDLGVAYADADSYFRMVKFPVATGAISNFATSIFEFGYTRFYMPTFDTDTSGQFYGMAVDQDHSVDDWNGTTHVSFFAIAPGTAVGPATSGQAANAVHTAGGWAGGAYDWGTNKRGLEHNFNVNFAAPATSTYFNSQRTQNPDVFTTGPAGNAVNYLVYYDQTTDQLKFRYMKITGTEAAGSNPGPWTTFDGAVMRDAFTTDANGSQPNFQVFGAAGSGGTSGPYATVGAWFDTSLSREVAFIAWYDQKNSVLRYSYNDNPSLSAQSGQWARNMVTLDPSFAGQFVKLAVDGLGGVHLAYYSNAGADLKYAYIKDYKNPLTTSTIVTVDSFLSVGTNTSISVVTNGTTVTPYITYYLPSLDQTIYSLRYATLKGGFNQSSYVANSTIKNAVDETSDVFNSVATTNWEVSSIPTANIPKNYQVGSAQVGTVTAPTFYTGYVTSANLEYARLK